MEMQQHTAETPVGNLINKRGNKKVHRMQWKWKYNLSESVGHSKACTKGKVNSYKCLH
jgi:hypothetical protein